MTPRDLASACFHDAATVGSNAEVAPKGTFKLLL